VPLRALVGIELDEASLKAISALGGLVAIALVIVISRDALGGEGAAMIIASMGASAVLLFAVPHGPLSQPWPVLMGHLLSAAIGVAAGKVIDYTTLAAAVAVGLAIGVMHQCKCIHPPGGATALTAVIAGPAVHDLGWSFVWRPVMLDALCIVAVAVLFNWPFPWRRYPAALVRRPAPAPAAAGGPTHEEIVAAMRSIDTFIDVSEDDLVRLYRLLADVDPARRAAPPS
jgi:CBS domain-containing membrane protein